MSRCHPGDCQADHIPPAALNIYTERLRQGNTQRIEEKLPADFLEVTEAALSYVNFVDVEGEAYLADEALIIHAVLSAEGVIPCSICNEPVTVGVRVENFYHAEPLQEIKSGIFNMGAVVREAILIETPMFAECNQGDCVHRKELESFLRPSTPSGGTEHEEIEGYHPFADL